jgi:hypothetical protein
MRAELKRIHSPDIDLATYWPDDPECFGFFLQFFAGPESEDGDDSFGITICTTRWLEREKPGMTFFASGYLIVPIYNLESIKAFIKGYCARCSGEDWPEVAAKIGKIAHWEFENYQANLPSQ